MKILRYLAGDVKIVKSLKNCTKIGSELTEKSRENMPYSFMFVDLLYNIVYNRVCGGGVCM